MRSNIARFVLILTATFFCLSTTGFARDVMVTSASGDTRVMGKPSGDEGIGVQFEDVKTEKRLMIDDFEDGNLKNRLNGDQGAWNLDQFEEDTFCYPEIVDYPSPELSQKVLKLEYDIDSEKDARNGFWIKLMNADASEYDHLEFLVRGDAEKGFTSKFIIEFKKFKDQKKRVEKLAASYVVEGVTSRWQRISIPLNMFSAIREWKDLDELVIIFHDRLCDVKEGALYFDAFQFKKTGHPGPSAFDYRGSTVRKTTKDFTSAEWAEWLSNRLRGYPEQVYVDKQLPEDDREMLMEIARDTWGFFDEIVDKQTHLPLDTICFAEDGVFGEGGYVGDYTNVTNIGLYLACLVAAMDFGFISDDEAFERVTDTLGTIESLETYEYFLYNYYDTTTAERTSDFISLIDSGWLTSGVYIVRSAFKHREGFTDRCDALLKNWDFSFFYDDVQQQFFHGYYENLGAHANYHYGAFYTEPRIISYLAIAQEDVPMDHWFKLDRTLPESYGWQQQIPTNRNEKEYKGVKYYGGYYQHKDLKYVPSWGGSAFEALMPTLLLKEKDLAPDSLGLNALNHSKMHAMSMEDTGYDVWGMSPSSVPEGGYSEYGVKELGLKGYEDGAVTPHATFLTLEYTPEEAIANIRRLVANYKIYGKYGFYDAVNPNTGKVALKYLCLDQGMIFLALDNYLNDGAIRERFHDNESIKSAEYLLTDENIFE